MKKLFTTSLLILSMIFLIGCGSKGENKNFGLSVFGLEKFSGLDKPEDNIKINLNGKVQDLSLPIYLDKNRYLIPIREIINNNNGEFKIEDDSLNIKFDNNLRRSSFERYCNHRCWCSRLFHSQRII